MRRGMTSVLTAVLSVVVLVLTATPSTAAAAPTPGAPGIGDAYFPTYGNGGYDAEHYAISIGYDPTTGVLAGTTVVTATATQDLSRFDLDFALTASAVSVNGAPARTSASGTELVVTPSHPLSRGERMTVTVTYGGKPADTRPNSFSPWLRTPTGAVLVGEPEASAWWFPGNDHPRDKATYDVTVTVPAGLQAISNGRGGVTRTDSVSSTWRWQESRPMATYLAFVAIGRYGITRGRTRSGIPYLNAVASGLGTRRAPARAAMARTAEIVDWEARTFGPYPFDTVGGVVPDADFGFALETQTRPVYSPVFFAGSQSAEVVVHELAHQWFGDSVSVHGWRDIWLNEGFATAAEWLYREHVGKATAPESLVAAYRQYPADDPLWRVTIGDPGQSDLFSAAVYDRGAMTLIALRNRVGGTAFLRLLREWAARHRYGNATVEEFVALAEHICGQDLRRFFRTWLSTPSKPAATPANGLPPNAAETGATRPSRVVGPAPLHPVQHGQWQRR